MTRPPPWLQHLVLAQAMAPGGLLVTADPAATPLVAALRHVHIRTVGALVWAHRLPSGGLVVRHERPGHAGALTASGPVLLDLTSVVEDGATELTAHRPDLVVRRDGAAIPDGFDVLDRGCPQILVSAARSDLAARLRAHWAELTGDDRHPAQDLAELASQAGRVERVSVTATGDIAVELDPLFTVRGLSAASAGVLVLSGGLWLRHGSVVRLRLPAFGEPGLLAFVGFRGPPPHTIPQVTAVDPQAIVQATGALRRGGAEVQISAAGLRAPWLDVDLSGSRFELVRMTIRLPGMRHRADAPWLGDPLDAYGDPLAAYEIETPR